MDRREQPRALSTQAPTRGKTKTKATPYRQRTLNNGFKGVTGSLEARGLQPPAPYRAIQSGVLQSRTTNFHLSSHLLVFYTDWEPTVCGLTVWGATVSPHRLWIYQRTYLFFTQTGGLQSGGLQSRTTDFWFMSAPTCALHRLGAYSLGANSLAPPILDLLAHLLVLHTDWGPSLGAYSPAPPI